MDCQIKTAIPDRADRRSSGRTAFTLIELLITVSIVLVLAALLFPTFKRMLEKSRQAVCAANLRQMVSLEMLYAGDHDGTFMPWSNVNGNYWMAWFYEYTQNGKVLVCPTHSYKDSDGLKCSYGYNGSLGNFGRKTVTVPARAIMWVDASAYLTTSDAYAGRNQFRQWIGDWHSKGSNLAFVDGHVEWWPYEKIYNDTDLPIDEQHFYVP